MSEEASAGPSDVESLLLHSDSDVEQEIADSRICNNNNGLGAVKMPIHRTQRYGFAFTLPQAELELTHFFRPYVENHRPAVKFDPARETF
ncbi:hypothetical protein EVAR_68987_1 [Eumeta japonica]|uniref:Uncharacterized protein n=1 Tax=Eumeta variegata TaxID=151549 RepID=A0A4C1ZWI5_EUMVA|nr:hypothetical protein EVAR_68987_1 [Eumeta japonica]